MRFQATISTEPDGIVAAEALLEGVTGPADLAVLFVSPHHRAELPAMSAAIRAALGRPVLIGCTCEGVIARDVEVERLPAASLLIASLPDVTIHPFHIDVEQWSVLLNDSTAMVDRLRTTQYTRGYIVLGDPYSTPITEVLAAFDGTGVTTVGGMASGGSGPGENVLMLNDKALATGVVGVSLGGNIRIETVVSQGCRPIGAPMEVTAADRNVIRELDGAPALVVTQSIIADLSDEDRDLVRNGLFFGVAIDESLAAHRRGDYLMRGVVGVDPSVGSIAIGDSVHSGQRVQLHLRDAAGADEDLRILLGTRKLFEATPAGALLFSCNGRGSRLFSEPGHDARAVQAALPRIPLAGFFAAGELGPIGGRTFIHGHTASLALFHPAEG